MVSGPQIDPMMVYVHKMRAQVHLPVHTAPELCGTVQVESLHRLALAPNDKGNRDIAEFSSVQFNVVSKCSEKPICAPSRVSEVSPKLLTLMKEG